MKVVFHEDFYQVYASDPAAAQGRMESIVEVIAPFVDFIEAEPALDRDILRVHEEPHVDHVKRAGIFDVAALAAGGAIQSAKISLDEPSFGLIRPPGHHASKGSAWGFCYFNNMAIALTYLKHKKLIETAYVLDIDLHFGDGNVNILKGKGDVTVHNIAAGEREAYLDEVREEMEDCRSDVIGISAGFDNHEDDWGGTLFTQDFYDIGRMVFDASARIGGGCFGILEGGYNHAVLGHNVMALINGLSGS